MGTKRHKLEDVVAKLRLVDDIGRLDDLRALHHTMPTPVY